MGFRQREGGDDNKRPARRGGRNKRRKVCFFTVNKITHIDYKDTDLLKKFISGKGVRYSKLKALNIILKNLNFFKLWFKMHCYSRR